MCVKSVGSMSIDNINKLFVDCSVGMNMGHGTWDSGTPAAGTRYLQLPGAGLSHNMRFICSYLDIDYSHNMCSTLQRCTTDCSMCSAPVSSPGKSQARPGDLCWRC